MKEGKWPWQVSLRVSGRRVRRFPHLSSVAADCSPLYFKVSNDKWRRESSGVSPALLRYPLVSAALQVDKNPTQTKAHTIKVGGILRW